MSKQIIFMFSGQGSQYRGMGSELIKNNAIYKKWMYYLNETVKGYCGHSIVDYIYSNSKNSMDETLLTHPALFMVQFSLSQALIAEGIKPDKIISSSLGEFVGLAVSGVMKVEDALMAVLKQASFIEKNCVAGRMLAIFDSKSLFQKSVIKSNAVLASSNFDDHFVVSGTDKGINNIIDYLTYEKIGYFILPVKHAFHSDLIIKAKESFLDSLRDYKLLETNIPLISTIKDIQVHKVGKEHLWDAVFQPMDFVKAVSIAEKGKNNIYIDLGPSGTLANFVKKNLKEDSPSASYSIMTPFNKDLKNLEAVKKIIHTSNFNRGKNMITYAFPGQGAQYKGMGETLFDEFPEITESANNILGYSIKDLCLNDPHNQLSNTKYTQPALYVVNVLKYLKELTITGLKPDYAIGHSLGEYNALFTAGVFNFETGLKLVKRRGELMSGVSGGGMAAVVGLDKEEIERLLFSNGLQTIDIANFNTPTQFVLAGPESDIHRAEKVFTENSQCMFIILRVSGAFHSRYMTEVKKEFESFLNDFTFNDPILPVISNTNARPYQKGEIKKNLLEQINHPVKWTEGIQYLMSVPRMKFEEIGPGHVLTGLIQTIKREAEPLDINKIYNEQVKVSDANKKSAIDIETEIKLSKDTYIEPKEEYTFPKYKISAKNLGNQQFKKDYNLKYAYLQGAMYKGIASADMVIKMSKSGMMGFLGTGGLSLDDIESSIIKIQTELFDNEPFGMNLLHNPGHPEMEERTVDLYLNYGITNIEASAYMSVSPALVKFRANGLTEDYAGNLLIENKIIAKVSRPEVAKEFLSPAPERIIKKLLEQYAITEEQARLLRNVPMADDICVEADSGGHTDQGVAYAIFPAIRKLRNEMMRKYQYSKEVRVGTAGGIGTPEAAAAAFIMGADFIVTGSINQCTVEAETSETVKDLLNNINVQDTAYAPAGDMFELGAKVQVLKKGLLFPSRANKLFELYQKHDGLGEMDEKTKTQLQEKFFKRSFHEVFEECKKYYGEVEIRRAEKEPKYKMAMIFKWYFAYSTKIALNGVEQEKVNFQIHCGPALGSFNQWAKGKRFNHWKNRHVDEIGIEIMNDAAKLLHEQYEKFVVKEEGVLN
ncbi:ACP S-malonyltransferase [Fictibacillus phosphorivorans]|uniref:ACP S-malonyltransferase n=1 Tax=Fictibacillus phosphorivorans TaxID=1221500 RepID=UPI003CE91D81